MDYYSDLVERGFIHSLLEGGYAEEMIVPAQEFFRDELLSLPVSQLEQTASLLIDSQPKSAIGFESTLQIPDKDDKLLFTYNPALKGNFDPTVHTFMEYARPLYETCEQIACEVIEDIGREVPHFVGEFGDPIDGFLRFIQYEPHNGDVACGHYDLGALTVHLGASKNGLHFVHKGEDIAVSHKEGEALIFPGLAMKDVCEEITPKWHYVRGQPGEKRIATVFFVWPQQGSFILGSAKDSHTYNSNW